MDLQIRPARREDAAFLVQLINAASRGFAFYVWSTRAGPGEDPWEFGLRLAQSDDSLVSWRKAWIPEVLGEPAGFVMAYRLRDVPEVDDRTAISPLFRPLDDLEAEAHGTGHISLMSVAEPMRGKGVGSSLLAFAERWRGPRGMSLIVSDNNQVARRLYERNRYAEAARRPIVKEGWQSTGTDWILMLKP